MLHFEICSLTYFLILFGDCSHLSFLLVDGYGFDTTHYGAYFGEGVGTIHINRLGCSGSEYRLVNCSSIPSTWRHNEDWSVTCKNGT